MKLTTTLIFLITLITNTYSQRSKTCETPENNFEDLNTITIKKCDIEQKKTSNNTRKLTTSISNKKKNNRIAHYTRKQTKTTSYKKYIKPKTKEILFSVVDEIPLFKKCNSGKNIACFNKEFYKHFSNNFNPINASEYGIRGRLFVQFTINTKGKPSDILVKMPKYSEKLEKEIKRVINKLPLFKPATHKSIPVMVKHSLPINLNY